MRSWLRSFALFTPACFVGLWIYWVPERLPGAWLVPAALGVGAVFATANELWNRPRAFLRELRSLAARPTRPRV